MYFGWFGGALIGWVGFYCPILRNSSLEQNPLFGPGNLYFLVLFWFAVTVVCLLMSVVLAGLYLIAMSMRVSISELPVYTLNCM